MGLHDRLHTLFNEGFCAAHIASPLPSFDGTREAATVRRLMEATHATVAGIRTGGLVSGWVREDDLTAGRSQSCARLFDEGQVVDGDSALRATVRGLDDHEPLFVTSLGQVIGVITRQDLHKPPARMWLFGMVSIIEMAIVRRIQELYPADTWQDALSEGRLRHARFLQSERRRSGQYAELIDCLQLGDKATILVRHPEFLESSDFETVGEAKRTLKRLQSLRNHLAHTQAFVDEDWEIIVRLSRRLDRIVSAA